MFYKGDLQSGISEALQHSKSVVCFIRDDDEESNKWESKWLVDQNIPAALERHAITFRLDAGSDEANMLSAFCSINEIPTVIVIHEGRLLDQLSAGITKNDFTLRLLRAINPSLRAQMSAAPPQQSSPQAPPQTSEQEEQTSGPTVSNEPSASSNLQDVFSERRSRIEAEKKAHDEAEKAKIAERAKARKKEAELGTESTTGRKQNLTYAQQQVQRKKEAQEERERVRKLIENDKKERKWREEQAKMQRQAADMEQQQGVPEYVAQEGLRTTKSVPGGSLATIHVRAMDGSTLRHQFSADDKLGSVVRSWIDANRTDGNTPYSLKVVLTPSPSRSLGESDEKETLRELGLAPSASLVMVPVQDFAQAYKQSTTGGATHLIWAVYAYIWSLIMAVVNSIRMFLGLNHTPTEPEVRNQRPSNSAANKESEGKSTSTGGVSKSGTRIRTLQDQNGDRDNQQLYNGNQLNFESNKKDDEDK